jgi:hypothetical protein
LFENWFFNADPNTVVENIQQPTMHGIAKQVNIVFAFKNISKKPHQKKKYRNGKKKLLAMV